MCVSHHLGLEIQLNEMLTDRARGGGGDGVGCASQSRCGSDRELCKRLEKTNRSQFPQVQEGGLWEECWETGEGSQIPGCSQMLTSVCRDPENGFLFKHTCQEPAACAQARKRGQREGCVQCTRRSRGCERKLKLLPFGLG